MQVEQLEVRILVRGMPVTEFQHQNQIFVEGRPGSEFEIQAINKTGQRSLVVISVDGLSIMDGKPASEDSSGYLVPAYGQVRIPGWMLDTNQVAKFTFGSRKDSYAQQGVGDATNCGVIGVMMFAEKVRSPRRGLNYSNIGGSYADLASANTLMGGATLDLENTIAQDAVNSSTSINNLGTEFGQQAEFKTNEVDFIRGKHVSTAVIYYDDSRGLKARGIVLERPSRQRYQTTPNPFPASGCKPPKGWTGR